MGAIENLIAEGARVFGVTAEDIYGPSRATRVVTARHTMAYVLRRRYPELSFSSIAQLLGRRNHMTIMHAIDAVERRASVDDDYARKITYLLRF